MHLQAVDYRKQKRISQAAQFFLLRYGYGEPPCRFDVVAIDGEQIQWIKNAFDYCGMNDKGAEDEQKSDGNEEGKPSYEDKRK